MTAYQNADVDALLEEARIELDPNQRLQLYQSIEEMLLRDVAAIPLRHRNTNWLVSSRIQGFVLAPMAIALTDLLSITPEAAGE